VELRKLPQLRERKRGYFSRGSRAFLHFHEDAGNLYVDVRLDSAFERVKVTSRNEQADLVSRVRDALQSTTSSGVRPLACLLRRSACPIPRSQRRPAASVLASRPER
jgi:hypothetical protein